MASYIYIISNHDSEHRQKFLSVVAINSLSLMLTLTFTGKFEKQKVNLFLGLFGNIYTYIHTNTSIK